MEKPRILLVSLYHISWFDEMYAPHLNRLAEKARVQRAKTAVTAIRQLSENPAPAAVLVTDHALVEEENRHVYEAVLRYVRQGGTAVLMAQFSGFLQPLKARPFFARAGLTWDFGSYHRTTFALQPNVVGAELAVKLPARYSQKALSLLNVKREEGWYCSDERSMLESLVWAPKPIHEPDQAPVAVGRVGNGRLAFIGDVNVEVGSGDVILALCGLL